jgi:hypothetical protein
MKIAQDGQNRLMSGAPALAKALVNDGLGA